MAFLRVRSQIISHFVIRKFPALVPSIDVFLISTKLDYSCQTRRDENLLHHANSGCGITFTGIVFSKEVTPSVLDLWTGNHFLILQSHLCSSAPRSKLPRHLCKIRTPTDYRTCIIKLGVNWHRHMTALANQGPGFMRNRSPDGGATGRRVRWRLTGTHSGARRRKLRAVACHFSTGTRLLYFKEVLLSSAR